MAAPGQPNAQQIAAMMAAEAQKRGMTVEQFKKQQEQALAQEANKRGITVDELKRQLQAQQIQQMQQQQQIIASEAAKLGITPQQYIEGLRAKQATQQAAQQAAQQQGQAPNQQQPAQQQQQIPVNPTAAAKPEALALATFLRSQNLKSRQCILNGQRKDMFKVKRALRAIQTPVYTKACSKNPLLPKVTDEPSARSALTLLPTSMLALRVSKSDPHAGHDHAKPKKDPKRVKGLWTVAVEPQQMFEPTMHYVWLYEGSQWKQKAYAAGALLLILVVIMFPLWPIVLRQGVWYLSVGMMGLLGLFFAMAIFRLILFCITVFTVPPGLWLFPNLFEDVGFFDSFKPVWGWQEASPARIPYLANIPTNTCPSQTKKKKKSKKVTSGSPATATEASKTAAPADDGASHATATTTATPSVGADGAAVVKRYQSARVEEVEDE